MRNEILNNKKQRGLLALCLAALLTLPAGYASAQEISLDEDRTLTGKLITEFPKVKPHKTEKTKKADRPRKEKKDKENKGSLKEQVEHTIQKDEALLEDFSTEPPEIRPGFIGIRGMAMNLPRPVNPDEVLRLRNDDKIVKDSSLKLIVDRLLTTAQIWELPANYKQEPIAGEGEVTRDQAAVFLRRYNKDLPIKATPEEIVELYYEEAGREGLRWDVAFCQALVETGFFRFGGTVVPEQNNFCGLGTTSATVQGAYFSTPKEGVRAHVQHLLAYTTPRLPKTPIIDPRYNLVHDQKTATNGFFTRWSQLNGKWATGSYYAEKILNLHEQMKKIIAVSGYHWKEEKNK